LGPSPTINKGQCVAQIVTGIRQLRQRFRGTVHLVTLVELTVEPAVIRTGPTAHKSDQSCLVRRSQKNCLANELTVYRCWRIEPIVIHISRASAVPREGTGLHEIPGVHLALASPRSWSFCSRRRRERRRPWGWGIQQIALAVTAAVKLVVRRARKLALSVVLTIHSNNSSASSVLEADRGRAHALLRIVAQLSVWDSFGCNTSATNVVVAEPVAASVRVIGGIGDSTGFNASRTRCLTVGGAITTNGHQGKCDGRRW